MKKNILNTLIIIILMFSSIVIKAQQALSLNLFSQNGWIQDTVGGGSNSGSYPDCPGLFFGVPNNIPCRVSTTNNINKNNLWNNVKNSQARLVRYGGITADQNYPEKWQYLKFVDSVRAKGMEPILQIPLNYGNDGTPVYDTTKAKNIIIYINQTMARNVVYWSIGNEPDHKLPGGYGYDTTTKVFLITTYIQNFSKAMRRAVPSVPIKICGPELAEWKSDPGYKKKKMVDSLLTPWQRCDISGFDTATGKPWIDVFSFHFYGGIDGDAASLPRATLIDKLRKTYGLAQSLDYLNVKLDFADSVHNRTGADTLLSAITEANIDFQSISNDTFSDVKCNGFFAGQYWLEIASIAAEKGIAFVNFWSAAESSMGYMKSDGTKKSSYYHFKKAAENFSGTYYTGRDSSTTTHANIKNIKAFGTKDANHIAIIIMNQDSLITNSKRLYSIRLNGSYPTTDTNRITLNMGVDRTYQDTIDASSTTMLEFDLTGNISQVFRYKQSLGSGSLGFKQPYCSLPGTYGTQALLNAYKPGVYSTITIGGTSAITINSGSTDYNNTIYRAVNSITINGDFEVPLGESLELLPTPCD